MLVISRFSVLSCMVLCAVPLIIYAVQHYLSIAGSLILIPLIIVPAMGGTPVSGECICSYGILEN